MRERISENAEELAQANGVQIEFIRKKDFRKENRIQKILKECGEQPDWCISLDVWNPALRIIPGTIKRQIATP